MSEFWVRQDKENIWFYRNPIRMEFATKTDLSSLVNIVILSAEEEEEVAAVVELVEKQQQLQDSEKDFLIHSIWLNSSFLFFREGLFLSLI